MNDNNTINSLVGRDIPQVSLDELIYGGYTSSSFKSPYETKAKNIGNTIKELSSLDAQGKLTAQGKMRLWIAESKYDNAMRDLKGDIQSRYGRFDAKRKSKHAKDLRVMIVMISKLRKYKTIYIISQSEINLKVKRIFQNCYLNFVMGCLTLT